MRILTISLLTLPFILVYILPIGGEGDKLNILLLYMACCYFLLTLFWFLKKKNENRFDSIKNHFNGSFSLMSQFFKSNYHDNEFSIFVEQQTLPCLYWHIRLNTPISDNLRLTIYDRNPGPVLLYKKIENDLFCAFSNKPEEANQLIINEKVKLILDNLETSSITEKGKKVLGVSVGVDKNKISIPNRAYSFFKVEKNFIETTIVSGVDETIEIDVLKKNIDQLIEVKNYYNCF